MSFRHHKVVDEWRGETVAILASGPSLRASDVALLRPRCRVLAINDALRLCPWADAHYFCDDKWWRWYKDEEWFTAYQGPRYTLENPQIVKVDPSIRSVRNAGRTGLCTEPDGICTGQNSGHQAINLTYHLRAKRILLLGYDMGAPPGPDRKPRLHFFGDHPIRTSPHVFGAMLPHFKLLAPELAARGVEVINCTPSSMLRVWPITSVERMIADGLLPQDARYDAR